MIPDSELVTTQLVLSPSSVKKKSGHTSFPVDIGRRKYGCNITGLHQSHLRLIICSHTNSPPCLSDPSKTRGGNEADH